MFADQIPTARPGTYRSALFAVDVEFTRNERFRTWGESGNVMNLDYDCTSDRCNAVVMYIPDPPLDLENIGERGCIPDTAEVADVEFAGLPARYLDAIAVCEEGESILDFGGWRIVLIPEFRTQWWTLNVDSRQLFIEVFGMVEDFEKYLEQTAGPILETVVIHDTSG